MQVAARSDLAAALVDAVQGLPDLVALGRAPTFLTDVGGLGWRLERADGRLAPSCLVCAPPPRTRP
jgi:hypothetical protein